MYSYKRIQLQPRWFKQFLELSPPPPPPPAPMKPGLEAKAAEEQA